MKNVIRRYIKKTPKRYFEKVSKERKNKDFDVIYVKDEDIKLPKRSTKWSAGYDFFAPFNISLKPNQSLAVPTGIRAFMQPDEVLKIYPRSGLGFKYFTRLANTVGIIDADYQNSDNEGHIFIKIRNEGDKLLNINKGEAFAQGIFEKYLLVDSDSFDNGDNRNGGFGSTTEN